MTVYETDEIIERVILVGVAFAHNFGIASSPKGVTEAGQIATVVCIVVLFVIAAVNLKRARS